MRRCIFLLVLLCALFPALLSCEQRQAEDYKIKILVAYPEGAVHMERHYLYLNPGEDAVFPFVVAEGYEYIGNDAEANYIDGTLILPHVRYPLTISLDVIRKETPPDVDTTDRPSDPLTPLPTEATFSYLSPAHGTLSVSHKPGSFPTGTDITLKADPAPGYHFIGWSEGSELLSGGNLLSEEPTYTLSLSHDITLFANFKKETEAIVCYHPNGGRFEGGSTLFYDTYPLDYYYYPNALADVGTLTRDGYTLLEYSTEENGGGFVTCPGGKIFQDTTKLIHLWAQWSKWSDDSLFQVSAEKGGCYITQYLGNEAIVSVPGRIGGKQVLGIRKGAFNGVPMHTLILNKALQVIEDEAFSNCQKLDTVYLCDSIVTLSDKIFKNCNAFSHFRYNAATPPVYSAGWGAYIRKFERVVYYYGKADTLAVLSGSSSLYGLDSPLLEELLAKEGHSYTVCNLGIQAGIPQLIYLEFLSHFTDAGDLILQAPEISSSTLGSAINDRTLSVLESGYNIFRYLDISRYDKLFSTIQKTNAERVKMKATSYYAPRKEINLHGDRIPEEKTQNEVFDVRTLKVSGSTLKSSTIRNFNEMYQVFASRNVKVYYTFAPLNIEAYHSTDADVAALHKTIDEKLLAPRISDFKDYLLERKYICNSDWHPTDKGAILRTERLARDILTQLKKENE